MTETSMQIDTGKGPLVYCVSYLPRQSSTVNNGKSEINKTALVSLVILVNDSYNNNLHNTAEVFSSLPNEMFLVLHEHFKREINVHCTAKSGKIDECLWSTGVIYYNSTDILWTNLHLFQECKVNWTEVLDTNGYTKCNEICRSILTLSAIHSQACTPITLLLHPHWSLLNPETLPPSLFIVVKLFLK